MAEILIVAPIGSRGKMPYNVWLDAGETTIGKPLLFPIASFYNVVIELGD
ncbi:MAG: hypothetical protein AAGA60_01410 [Cyanobacteria bacterium P01_E01_bin.42]